MNLGELYGEAKDNWRILLLVTMLVVSGIAITFGPDNEGPTSLKYGLQLSGGSQVRAPLEGKMASGLDYSNVSDVPEAEATVAEELGLDHTAVKAYPTEGVFEVYSENVSDQAIAAALRSAGFDVQAGDVEEELTAQTYRDAKNTIQAKISESQQFSGGEVTVQQSTTGGRFLKIEVPGATRAELLELVRERGLVEVVAIYPEETANGTVYRNATLFTQEDLATVGTVQQTDAGTPFVPVTLTENGTQQFIEDMRAYGFAGNSDRRCRFESSPQAPGYCLVVYKDGEYVNSFGMEARLARSLEDGSFGGSFRMTTGAGPNATDAAEEVRIAMKAGALPTNLDLDEGDSMVVESEFAQRFKLFSLITGIIAALAVALTVFVRYREPRVAAPMVVTALSEVFILLGVAAATSLPLNLSHIAGFIAVIGTGVDDLVIIADEVLTQGDIETRRVFQSRFRKAFWVIGIAAVTTIIAMAPLTVLSLGDLTGFAMVTITGVLIGVLVTRPAYGDILRALITRRRND